MPTKLMRRLAIVLLMVYAGFSVFLFLHISKDNESRQKLVSTLQEVPDVFFWTIFVIFLAVMGFLLWDLTFGHKIWDETATKRSVANAKMVASSLWVVNDLTKIGDSIGVGFRHFSFSAESFILWIRPGHPDIAKFQDMKKGDVVEFSALEEGMECALPHELCGFLRLEAVNSED